VRSGIENALLHRVRPKTGADQKGFELSDEGRQYRGMTMLRIAEAYVNQTGVRTTSMSKMEIAALALGLTERAHTTSDFPNLLADVANKTLRAAYNEAPQTWAPISRVPTLFGRSARNLESDTVWGQITANAAMGDGVALFHATHANLSASSDAIAIAPIGAGRAAMRVQKGVDGVTLLNVFPNYLIVPAGKETIADQFVSTNLMAAQSSNVNPFAGRLTVIAEPRLDAVSATAWYLASTPDQIDIIEYAYLEGEEGPMVESRVGWEVDGLEIKCREDFAAKVIDHRGLWKNPGA